MKKFNRLIQIFLAVTILLSSMIFQPINVYAQSEDEILEFIEEKLEIIYNYIRFDVDYDNYIKIGGGEQFSGEYWKATSKDLSYNKYKSILMENLTPFCAIHILDNTVNVNNALYVNFSDIDGMNPFINFSLEKDLEIKTLEDNVILVFYRVPVFEGFVDGDIKLKKINNKWYIDYIENFIADVSRNVGPIDYYMQGMFRSYIHKIVMGFIVSENINCGYEKFSQEANEWGSLSAEIIVDSFDSESCTGKGHAILDEYDESGNVISQHKIVVEIGENLSEKVTDYDLSKDNPDTADMDFVFIAFAVVSGAALLLMLNKKYNRPYEKN